MRLLLVPNRWPHGPIPEFLDAEVGALAETFNEVQVAPLRPRGGVVSPVPAGVRVDYSLAEWLGQSRANRYLRAARSAVTRAGVGFGTTRSELVDGFRDLTWARAMLLSRADCVSVKMWAKMYPPPAVAYTFWLGAATAGLRSAWPDTPVVSRAHGGDLYGEAHGWKSIPYQRDAVMAADLLAPISEHGRDYLVSKFPGEAAKVQVHRLGFPDIGGLADPGTQGSVSMISVSSIDQNKRVDRIARVAIELARSGTPVMWTHLGDGPQRALVEELLTDAPDLLEYELRGVVPHEQVVRELRHGRHSVLVNLSLSEGAPVSLMEAQCVGLPVVATRVGGSAEVADPALNWFVDVDADLTTLADAVRAASARPLTDASQRRAHWLERYHAERVCPVFARELLRVAASRGHHPDPLGA